MNSGRVDAKRNVLLPNPIMHSMKTSKIISNSNQINIMLHAYTANGFDKVSTIAIVYPILVNVYDATISITDTVKLQDNKQFFEFIDAQSGEINAAIVYPILMSDSDGNYFVVRNDAQLEVFLNLVNTYSTINT